MKKTAIKRISLVLLLVLIFFIIPNNIFAEKKKSRIPLISLITRSNHVISVLFPWFNQLFLKKVSMLPKNISIKVKTLAEYSIGRPGSGD